MLPLFATGEPKKQYYFLWALVPRPLDAIKALRGNKDAVKLIKKIMNLIQDTVAPVYVSQLAKKIDFPAEKVSIENISMGPLQIPYPTGFPLDTIKVTYVEDELNTVFLWHRKWQNYLWDTSLTSRTLGLSPIDSCCFSAHYIPEAALPSNFIPSLAPIPDSNFAMDPIDTLLPVGMENYPKVFPMEITRDSVDKSASGISTTTVTYIRVPEISSPDSGLTGLLSKASKIFGF